MQTFPEPWKIAKVIPLYKKNETTLPENFCPVSLLNTVSKALERAVFNQMVDYFETNALFHPSHHGFRKSHNTTTALIEMIDKWANSFDCGKISAVVALDMSVAFDLVSKNTFLNKLEAYNASYGTIKWVESYLSGRKQRVYVDGSFSSDLQVDTGVPQGSLLGPLFYIIYLY